MFWQMSFTPRCQVVSEDHVWPQEYVILDGNAGPYRNTALDGDVISKPHTSFYEAMIVDITVASNCDPGENMRKRVYSRLLSNVIGLNDRSWVNEHTLARFWFHQ